MKKILILLALLISIVQAKGYTDIRIDYGENRSKYCNVNDKTTTLQPYAWLDSLEIAQTFLNNEQLELVYSYLGIKGKANKGNYLVYPQGRCGRIASNFIYDYFGYMYYENMNEYEISKEELQFGDLVRINYGDWAHVVVYLGNGLVLSGNDSSQDAEMFDSHVAVLDYLKTYNHTNGTITYLRTYKDDSINISCQYVNLYGGYYESVKGTKGC